MAALDTQTESQLEQQFALAAERFEAGDISGAQAVLEDMLTKVPDHPIILNYLAVIAHLSGDLIRAEGLLRNSVKIMPDFFDAWNNLGLVAFGQGKHEDAAHAFQQACSLAPEAPDPTVNRAMHYRPKSALMMRSRPMAEGWQCSLIIPLPGPRSAVHAWRTDGGKMQLLLPTASLL